MLSAANHPGSNVSQGIGAPRPSSSSLTKLSARKAFSIMLNGTEWDPKKTTTLLAQTISRTAQIRLHHKLLKGIVTRGHSLFWLISRAILSIRLRLSSLTGSLARSPTFLARLTKSLSPCSTYSSSSVASKRTITSRACPKILPIKESCVVLS